MGRLNGLAGPFTPCRRGRQSPLMPSPGILWWNAVTRAPSASVYSSLIHGDMLKRGVDRLREPTRRTCTSCFHVRLVQHGSAAMPKPPRRDLPASAIAP